MPDSIRCRLHGGRPPGTPQHPNTRAAAIEGRRRWLERMRRAKAAGLIEKIPGGRRKRGLPKLSKDRIIARAQRVLEEVMAKKALRVVGEVDERRDAVLQLMEEGYSNREIAKILGVDESTVREDKHAENPAPSLDGANEVNGLLADGAENPAPHNNHRAQGTGENEWFTPPEVAAPPPERRRRRPAVSPERLQELENAESLLDDLIIGLVDCDLWEKLAALPDELFEALNARAEALFAEDEAER
jgi:hypothetical protein